MVLIDLGSVSRTVSCPSLIIREYFSFTHSPATVALQMCLGSISVCCFYFLDIGSYFIGVEGPGGALYLFHSCSQTPSVILYQWRKLVLVSCPAHSLSCEHPVGTHGKGFVSRCRLPLCLWLPSICTVMLAHTQPFYQVLTFLAEFILHAPMVHIVSFSYAMP